MNKNMGLDLAIDKKYEDDIPDQEVTAGDSGEQNIVATDENFVELIDHLAIDHELEAAYEAEDSQGLGFPDDYTMTLDKVTECTFSDGFTYSPKDITLWKDKSGKDVSIRDYRLIPMIDGVKPDAAMELRPFDKTVFFGVASLLVRGKTRFTAKTVLDNIRGKQQKEGGKSKILREVEESLWRMNKISITFSWRDILRIHGYGLTEEDTYKCTNPILSYEKSEQILSNGRRAELYQISRIPDLLKLAFILKQVTTVTSDRLLIGKHVQERDFVIRDYLLKRIKQWSNKNNRKAPSIVRFDTIYNHCLPKSPNPSLEKKLRAQIFEMLRYYEKIGLISGYKKNYKHRVLISFELL